MRTTIEMDPEHRARILELAASRGEKGFSAVVAEALDLYLEAQKRRSGFISEAVLHYVESQERQSLEERLKAGYRANADESLRMALEWFPLEEEAWQGSRATGKRKR